MDGCVAVASTTAACHYYDQDDEHGKHNTTNSVRGGGGGGTPSVVVFIVVHALGVPVATIIRRRRLGLLNVSSFLRELKRVFYTARARQDVRVVWVVVTFADHRSLTEAVRVVQVSLALPLCVNAIPAFVGALDAGRGVLPLGRAADGSCLRDWTGPSSCCHPAVVERERLHVREQHPTSSVWG